MTSTGFPKASRLLNASDFDAVFAKNQFKVANRYFLILALSKQISSARLGMVVAKKNIPLAVQRNRIRRLVRDSFRNNTKRLQQLDVVVLVKKGTDKLGNPEIRNSLEALWKDLEKKYVAA